LAGIVDDDIAVDTVFPIDNKGEVEGKVTELEAEAVVTLIVSRGVVDGATGPLVVSIFCSLMGF
jgi:hypothetical protein